MTRTYAAAQCTDLSFPDGIEIVERESASLRRHEVRLKIRATGLNYPDYLMSRGEYQYKSDLPFVPGMEVSGEVIEIGADVTRWCCGQYVMAAGRMAGFAEEMTIDQSAVLLLPQNFSFEQGTSFLVANRTAYNALFDRSAVKPYRMCGLREAVKPHPAPA
ncbi:alcohol dehydrogenase catalytic domain-containing protein [Parasphingorhabdus flavimaris]|uniref:alcohol dehydrogenase catalytic domain-containing protein n=1 Tax=Parasphingorhabdus flavimaris TaxID=266812 RepID=UPI003001DF95